MKRILAYSDAVNEALSIAMEQDQNVICYGLGVDDPKGVFGTTLGLKEKFGEERVFDMPTSENAMTGVAIGSALNGIRPVMSHQRLDFFLLALDQLVNNAAKWNYMFGGGIGVPITIRLVLGKGWGQGPTHSQNLHAWFSHIPGLKVVCPSNAYDAKGLLLSSIFDDNPVIFLEHRWVHNLEEKVPEGDYRVPIGKAKVVREGKDISIITLSYMVQESLQAISILEKEGISCELIDLRSVNPIDWELIFESVRKTGRLMAIDTSSITGSLAGEIVARVSTDEYSSLRSAPKRLALPDYPTPTSFALTKNYYLYANDIVSAIGGMFGKDIRIVERCEDKYLHDVPGDWFKGPF